MADYVDVLGQIALLTQVITCAHYKLTLGIVVFESTLRVIIHTVSVVKQRGLHLHHVGGESI